MSHLPSSAAEPGRPPPLPRHYRGLDLIRGLAAVVVLVYHADFMFGLRDRLLPGGYLSVDLFFILSGFVIACNYEDAVRHRRITFAQFMVRRVARLYPLYLLMFAVGLVVMTARYRSLYGPLAAGPLVATALANLLMLPSFVWPYGQAVLFPFNAASWSIFYELVINAVFAVLLARLASRTLVAAWVAAALVLAATVLLVGTLDVGWGAGTFAAGFPRVAFSFTTGMLIWRGRAARAWTTPGWVLAGLLAGCGVLAQVRLWIPPPLSGATDLAAVTLLLPAVVAAGVGATLRGRNAAAAALLGDISYAVYLTQGAQIITAAGLVQAAFGRKIYDFAPLAGFVFIPACLALSWLCFTRFERPALAWARSVLSRKDRSAVRSGVERPGRG